MNADEIVYIGDNPTKDFMAPTQLGMKHIYYKNPGGLYYDKECSDTPIIENYKTFERAVKGLM